MSPGTLLEWEWRRAYCHRPKHHIKIGWFVVLFEALLGPGSGPGRLERGHEKEEEEVRGQERGCDVVYQIYLCHSGRVVSVSWPASRTLLTF